VSAVAQVMPGNVVAESNACELPFVSVIVPTYERGQILPYLFEAVARQVYPAERMELIVIDNSSRDDTEAVVESWRKVLPFGLTFVRKENRGPASSRNRGASLARGDVLAFTDSDCLPRPHWLRAAVRRFEEGVGLVCGPIVPLQRAGAPGLLAAQLPTVTRDEGLYPTANLLVRRSDFEAVGGFDERLGLLPWGELVAGEDCDLAWRVRRTGASATFTQQAEVGHLATRVQPWRLLLRPFRVQVMPALVRRVPEIRATYLWNRYFLSASRVLYYLALAGLVAAVTTRNWPWLLAVVPWLVRASRGTTISLLRRGLVPKALVWIGMVAWFDTVTTVGLAIGSARSRAVVL
jgi:glycosyltransferase involved in cell wall biosynthesis